MYNENDALWLQDAFALQNKRTYLHVAVSQGSAGLDRASSSTSRACVSRVHALVLVTIICIYSCASSRGQLAASSRERQEKERARRGGVSRLVRGAVTASVHPLPIHANAWLGDGTLAHARA